MPVTVTIDGRTLRTLAGSVAVRLRGAARDPRADVLSPGRALQGVPRRDHRGRRVPLPAHRTPSATCGAPIGCRASAASRAGDGRVRGHTMRRGRMRIERQAPALAARGGAVSARPRRDARRRQRAARRRGHRSVPRRAPRHRPRPGHVDRRPAAARPRDRRSRGGHVVREPSTLRRVRRDGAHPVRRRTRAGAARATRSRRTSAARSRSSRSIRPRSTRSTVAGNSTMRDLFFRKDVGPIGQSPYRSITEVGACSRDGAPPPALADTGRGCGLPRRTPTRACTGCPSSPVTWAPTRPPACWPPASPTRRSPRGRHGHRHQHGDHRGQPAPHRRGVVPGRAGVRGRRRRVRHARARGRRRVGVDRRGRRLPPRRHRRRRGRRASAARGWSTC